MPIRTERLDVGIYHHQWQGDIRIDEVLAAFELEMQLFAEDDISHYVVIINGTDVRTMPVNFTELGKAISGRELMTFIYDAPQFAMQIGEIISRLFRLNIAFYDDWDAMITRAYEVIDEAHHHEVSQH